MKYVNYHGGGASLEKKTLKTWTPSHFSAKTEIDRNINLLRARSADLYKNSALGAAVINTLVSNVVADGLKVFPRIRLTELGLTPQAARAWRRKVKQEFELWTRDCDFLRRNNFYELQTIAFTNYLVDGDCFCLLQRDNPSPYSLKIRLIEAARVSNPGGLETEIKIGENRCINGIETDKYGRLAAIHVSNRIWNEFDSTGESLRWQRVKYFGETTGVRNVLHICQDIRAEQNRGVPVLAPVIESLKQLSRYTDAELTSAIIKSFFSVFFTQPASNLSLNEITGEELDVTEYKLGSGTISALPRGVDVKAIDAQNAQNVFDSFVTNFIKQIGAALNLPYEVLMKHFQSSYSASRAALLQANAEFNRRKAAFVNDFCRPLYEQWLDEAVLTGRVIAAGYFEDEIKKAAWRNASWYNTANKVLDPQRETNAMILRLRNNLSSYERELAQNFGEDFDEVLDVLTQERELLNRFTASDA